MLKTYHSEKAPKAVGPYAQCVQGGNFYYLSGQTPIVPEKGTLIEGDIKVQTEQVFHNISCVLEAAGLKKEDVIKSTVFLITMDNFKPMNEVYQAFFGEHKPARSAFAVKALPLGADVEIEVIAYKEAE